MTDEPRRAPHPAVYLVLYTPYGIATGYVTVTLAWLLSHAGASVAAVAGLAGLGLLPNTWKVFWSPLIDISLSSRAWFVIGTLATAATLFAMSLLPLQVGWLPTFGALVFVNSVAGTLTNIAVERIMAFDTPHAEKGRAGGWGQAGNLGGVGLGGGAGLALAQYLPAPWASGGVLAVLCLACLAPLAWLNEPGRLHASGGWRGLAAETWRDLLGLVKTRIGLLACFIMLLPMGSGGAQQVWAAIAKDWGVGPDEVAIVNGVLQGLVSIPGCILGGWLADRIDRKRAYAIFGVVLAAMAAAMALGPRTPWAFLVFASAYNAGVGFCYGAFAAVTLEAIGKGAAATKYNLISSLSNVPILLVTLVDGWTQTRWGSGAMLLIEAAIGMGAVALYVAVAWATRGLSWGVIFGRGRVTAAS